jgi:hypothetical protein
MRSRKLSPGRAVTSTTIRSDSTRVPPVTPLRSVPASRTTGADSPVIADSSTVAAPSTTSPSAGTTCPATTTTRSPGDSSDDQTSVTARRRRGGGPWCRCGWPAALPPGPGLGPRRWPRRTSTSCTVQEQEAAIGRRVQPRSPGERAPAASSATSTVPTPTVNITGFLTSRRGWSPRTESTSASRSTAPVRRGGADGTGSSVTAGRRGPAPRRGAPPPVPAPARGRRSGAAR